MQYKSLITFSLLAALSGNATAQHQLRSAPKTRDTVIVLPKPCANIDSLAWHKFAALAQNIRQKPVPLAGEKSYFGNQHDYVISFVKQYFGAHTKTLSVVLDRSTKRFPLFDNILTKHDLPKELKYLAVIESALNNTALSHAGAVGPWQLMEGTARDLGLTVNGNRDDRTDWYKSTNAAAKYLRSLYNDLGDWLLVIAAYNSGPVPVVRAMQRTGSRSFWDIKKYLPRETQGHVLAFIATASIFEKLRAFIPAGKMPADFAWSKENAAENKKAAPPKPRFTDEELKSMAIVRITEPVNFDLLCQELKMDKKQLDKWNDDYDLFVYDSWTEDHYKLRIPKDKLDAFVEKKEVLTKQSKKMFGEEIM